MDRRGFIKVGLKVLCVLPFVKPLLSLAKEKPIEKLSEIRKTNGRKFRYLKEHGVFQPYKPWTIETMKERTHLIMADGRIFRAVNKMWTLEKTSWKDMQVLF